MEQKQEPEESIVLLLNVYSKNKICVEQLTMVPNLRHDNVVDSESSLANANLAPIDIDEDIHWDKVKLTIQEMAKKASEKAQKNPSVRSYVAGRSPLPAFALLGFAMTKSAKVTFLNPRHLSSEMEKFKLDGVSSKTFFEEPKKETVLTNGSIAVITSLSSRTTETQVQQFANENGVILGDIISLKGPTTLTEDSSVDMADHAFRFFRQVLPSKYPNSSNIMVFVEGPAPLAFAVGQAFDKRLHRSVQVPFFKNNRFVPALVLAGDPATITIPNDSDHLLKRSNTLQNITSGIKDFKTQISKIQKPLLLFLKEEEVSQIIERIQEIEIQNKEGTSDEFEMDVDERKLIFNRGLLHALSENISDEQEQQRIGLLIFVHEIYHTVQNLRTTNYHGIGRAGFALEEIDYWADAVSIGVLSALDVAYGGLTAIEALNERVAKWIQPALRGMEAFDRVGNPNGQLDPFYERRLRRYLIWYLQLARARALPKASNIEEAYSFIKELMGERLFLEVAPLAGSLDERYDKKLFSNPCIEHTELCIVVQKKLFRLKSNPSFNLPELVNAVRTFNTEKVLSQMKYIRGQISELRVEKKSQSKRKLDRE